MIARTGSVTRMPLLDLLAAGPEAWDDLVQRSGSASPFMSWAWHRAWASCADPDEARHSQALVVYGPDGRLEALLPVVVRSVRFRRVSVSALTWAIGDLGCPDHLDVAATHEADLDAVVSALERLPWTVLTLGLAEAAPNAHRLGQALGRRGFAVRRAPLWSAPYLDLPESWDAYLAGLSRNRRQTLRRKERKLHREHEVTLVDYDSGRLEEGWGRLLALHARRWEGAGAFGDPRVIRLHEQFAAELARRGELWLSVLELDGEPAAAWYGFSDRDTVYFYQSGREPNFERESVGDVLMAIMIRRAIERGYRRFDFLRGEEPYKGQWTSTARTMEQLTVFRSSVRGHWLRALDWGGRMRERVRAAWAAGPTRGNGVTGADRDGE